MDQAISQAINLGTYLAEFSEQPYAPFLVTLTAVFFTVVIICDWLERRGKL